MKRSTSGTGPLPALRWFLTRRPSRWPRSVEQPVLRRVPERGTPGEVSWVMIGHSTVLLQLGSVNLLFDPIWSQRCSPLSFAGPRRVRVPALDFEALPPIDAVLVSHSHYDHCDRPTLERLAREHRPQFFAGRGVGELLQRWGAERVTELDWWATTEFAVEGEAGVSQLDVQFVPARHFSARGLHDRDRTLWGGFWLQELNALAVGRGNAVYFCGDTGFDEDLFVEMRERNGRPTVAFLPIGAYDPRWFMAPVHVNPEEAVEIHRILGAQRSVGMHCATFQLTDEPIDEPAERLVEATRFLAADEGEFTLPQFGVLESL